MHISLALNNILGHSRDVQSLALNKILDQGKGLALNNILGHGRDMQSLALNKLLEAKRCEMSGPK